MKHTNNKLQALAEKVLFNEYDRSDLGAVDFYRLPGHIINNELFVAVRNLNALQQGLRNGDDLNLNDLKSIISTLQDVAKEAKGFSAGAEVPLPYQYKSKTSS